MRTDDEQQVFQQIAGAFDTPAYIRRALDTESAWTSLVERAQRKRTKQLEMPGLRVARLVALTSGTILLEHIVSTEDANNLLQLHHEWKPELKRAIEPATGDSEVRKELSRLVDSFERFNAKWQRYVDKLDFDYVNSLRDSYNKYYVLEKECALQSFRTASMGFQPLPLVSAKDVFDLMPLLNVPSPA